MRRNLHQSSSSLTVHMHNCPCQLTQSFSPVVIGKRYYVRLAEFLYVKLVSWVEYLVKIKYLLLNKEHVNERIHLISWY